MRARLSVLALAAAGVALLGACANQEEASAPNVLLAAKVATPPAPDGDASDPAWAAAKAITVEMTGGKNFAGGQGRKQGHLEGRLQRRHGVLPGPVRRPYQLHPPRPLPEAGRWQLEKLKDP